MAALACDRRARIARDLGQQKVASHQFATAARLSFEAGDWHAARAAAAEALRAAPSRAASALVLRAAMQLGAEALDARALVDGVALGQLREALAAASYDRWDGPPPCGGSVESGADALEAAWAGDEEPRRLELRRLFLLHRALPAARAAAALGAAAGAAAAAGLVSVLRPPGELLDASAAAAALRDGVDGVCFANAMVWVVEGAWLLTDFPGTRARGNAVMYYSACTRALLAAAPRLPADRLLDACCGCGVVGIVAARTYAETVDCADVNPRALAFCAANAAWNGVAGRVRALASDALDAAELRRDYDAVLANPPFVPRPSGESTALYSDGGFAGDAVLARVLAAAPSRLRPGGAVVCVALVADALVDGGALAPRALAAAVAGTADVVRGRPTRARDYAGRVGHLTAAHAAAFAPNLEARGIDTLAQALFFLRSGGGECVDHPRPGPDGDDLWADAAKLAALRAEYEARWRGR